MQSFVYLVLPYFSPVPNYFIVIVIFRLWLTRLVTTLAWTTISMDRPEILDTTVRGGPAPTSNPSWTTTKPTTTSGPLAVMEILGRVTTVVCNTSKCCEFD